MRLVCSAVSTVLDLLRPLVVVFPSPVQLRIMNGRKLTRVASSAISICLLVIITDANSNKTKTVPAVVAASIAAGAWWVVPSQVRCY